MRVECNHFLIPFEVFESIKPQMVRLDYDFVGSNRVWRLHHDPKISVQAMHVNDLTAMQVAQKLER